MNRRIVLLNLVLVALAGALVWMLRANWLEAQARERAVLARKVAPKAVLVPPSPPVVKAATPADYIEVASKMLFSKDRNPTVVVEPPKPAPEPVMPALPDYHGQMALGEPVILLSASKDIQHGYRAGDQVGDFKLVSFNADNIVFEWKGKTIERKLDELRAKQTLAQASTPGMAPVMARPPNGGPGFPKPLVSSGRSNAAASAEPSPAASSTTTPPSGTPTISLSAPGSADTGATKNAADASDDGMLGATLPGGHRACVAADTSPAGTMHSGYRKVQSMSIFGPSCDWEPVQ